MARGGAPAATQGPNAQGQRKARLRAFDEWVGKPVGQELRRRACARRAQKCLGFALEAPLNFTAHTWRTLREQDLIAVVTEHRHSILRGDPPLMKLHQVVMPHIYAAVRDCAGGVVTALAYGIPDMSQLLGDTAALQAFKVASLVHSSLDACGGSEWELTRPDSPGTRFAPNFLAFPLLLGFTQRRCGDGAPRIFVQDVGRAQHAARCSTGLRSTEAWFHRQLLYSDCSMDTTATAQLVFIPLYSVCNHYRMQRWTEVAEHGSRFPFVRPYFELAEAHMAIVRELPRRSGNLADYLLFFPEEKWPMFGMGDSSLTRPRLLVVEARPIHCTHYDQVRIEEVLVSNSKVRVRCFHCHSCFRQGYDVVIPSFIDYYTRELLSRGNFAYHERRFLIVWFGNGGPGSTDGTYGEVVNWRWRLQSLQHIKHVVIGGYHESYEYLLGESRFCLVPKGLGYWTHRLYEAIRAGCIPVILSDHLVLPFQGVAGIDWTQFSVKWPEELIGLELYRWLLYLDRSRGPALKAALDEVACWFDYHSEGDCNPLSAALQELAAPPMLELPAFWHSPNFALRTPEELLQRWLRERSLAANASEIPHMVPFREQMEASRRYGGSLA